MSASLFNVLARSIIWSAASCCSQLPAAARRVEKAVMESGLHWSAPPAVRQAACHCCVESEMVCAMRLLNGAAIVPYARAASMSMSGERAMSFVGRKTGDQINEDAEKKNVGRDDLEHSS